MRTIFLALFCAMLFACSKQPAVKPVEVERMAVEQAIPQGDTIVPLSLALAYANGFGVAEDPAEAVKWFRKAAEQGDVCAPYAQYRLGLLYAGGLGVAKDPPEAVNWYRKAAEQGIADAQFRLGLTYANGEGVVKEPAESVGWYRKAAEQGHAIAQFKLGRSYDWGNGVAEDAAEAVNWYRKAAEGGNPDAQLELGGRYATGTGVAEDPAESLNWYRKAAEVGDVQAQYRLGVMYVYDKGGAQAQWEGVNRFRKAADQGYTEAQSTLGWMYSTGFCVAEDPMEAVKWIRKSAEQGCPWDQLSLGVIYSEGKGVLKDEIEALAWFNISGISRGVERNQALKNRDVLEHRLGQQAALMAQQRSKEILKQIEANKAGAGSGGGVTAVPPLQTERGGTPKATGSGAIVLSSGYILTAAHVIANAARVTVTTAQGTKPATVVRVDEPNDLAVLKIGGGTYSALPIASSRSIRLGQSIATIGFPNVGIQGFSPKLTRGEISSLNGIGDDPRSWQISAPVQPGNSGGPLLNENGNLIGVVLAKLGLEAAKATGDLPQNVGYAVKSAYAIALLEPYLNNNAPEPNTPGRKPSFEDMVAKAQQSVVLILVY